MDFEQACEIAESCDLPDGACYAMIGDLIGIGYEAVMDLFAQQAMEAGND